MALPHEDVVPADRIASSSPSHVPTLTPRHSATHSVHGIGVSGPVSIDPVRSRVVLLAVVIALGASSVAISSADGGRRQLVVRGYPYARGCPAAGARDVVDRWGMYACNCTSYVAWALAANDQPIDWFIPGAMNAWNWPHVARLAGLRVDRSPAIGSIAAWPRVARPFGHVAYVTAVDGIGRVDVAEYNFPGVDGKQTYLFSARRFVSTVGALFIHVPQRAAG